MERHAEALYAKAGVEDEAGLIHKHKWMRSRTFDCLMRRADRLSRRADEAFLYRLLRVLGRAH